jgi:hypothetical protein
MHSPRYFDLYNNDTKRPFVRSKHELVLNDLKTNGFNPSKGLFVGLFGQHEVFDIKEVYAPEKTYNVITFERDLKRFRELIKSQEDILDPVILNRNIVGLDKETLMLMKHRAMKTDFLVLSLDFCDGIADNIVGHNFKAPHKDNKFINTIMNYLDVFNGKPVYLMVSGTVRSRVPKKYASLCQLENELYNIWRLAEKHEVNNKLRERFKNGKLRYWQELLLYNRLHTHGCDMTVLDIDKYKSPTLCNSSNIKRSPTVMHSIILKS